MLTCLSYVYAILSRWGTTRRLLPLLRLPGFGRLWLRRTVRRRESPRPGDITIVIGARNRSDYRLSNALRSIRAQEYPADAVRVIVVDYGSEPESARGTRTICEAHRARYVAVDHAPVWSRSRCLNIGIRLADSKFLMTSDVDVVLSPRYLRDAVHALAASPLSVVCSPMLDLPEDSVPLLEQAAGSGEDVPCDTWKPLCKPRYDWKYHPSIGLTYTAYYKLVRGYDEYYEVWGLEDDDLMRRFTYMGLEPKALDSGSFYLHQWHPKFEGVPDGRTAAQVQLNQSYFEKTHSILRNGRDWGIPPARAPKRMIA